MGGAAAARPSHRTRLLMCRPSAVPPPPAKPGSEPRPPSCADDSGAQALELSVALPIVIVALLVVLAGGQVVIGVAATDRLAALAARTAATQHDDAVHALLDHVPGAVAVIDPPSGSRREGDLVTVTLSRPLSVLIGPPLQVTGAATARTEPSP